MRCALMLILTLTVATPVMADVGYSACVWGTLHTERSTPINFQWRQCYRYLGAEHCKDWMNEEIVSANPKEIGTKTLQVAWDDEFAKKNPKLRDGPALYFMVRYDSSSQPGIQNKTYQIDTFYEEKLPRDSCTGYGNEHRFVVTPTGLDLVKGCPTELKECLN